MQKFVAMSQVSARCGSLRMLRNGDETALHVISPPPLFSVIHVKGVFLTAYSVKLSGEFRLVLSR